MQWLIKNHFSVLNTKTSNAHKCFYCIYDHVVFFASGAMPMVYLSIIYQAFLLGYILYC